MKLKHQQPKTYNQKFFSGAFFIVATGLVFHLYTHYGHSYSAQVQKGSQISLAEICQHQMPLAADLTAYDFLEKTKEMTLAGRSNAKPEILSLIDEVQKTGFVMRRGKDADVRPPFVGAQAEIERVLSYLFDQKEIIHLVGVIHTPMPATPLCTAGEISSSLVAPSLEGDEKRLYTVKERPGIIRDYLSKGGILYIVYPEGGREKRSLDQLKIYDAERAKYPHTLIDQALSCSQMDKEMVGATYFFKTARSGWFSFSIMSTQANAPTDDIPWAIWFGSLKHPKVRERAESLLSYLSTEDGPDISSQLFN
ncbi:MAG: hypothetical protein HYX48_04820 [Chlamydiales bacterium]|nr:hypothetical protein [Chlamydiales bacterium]